MPSIISDPKHLIGRHLCWFFLLCMTLTCVEKTAKEQRLEKEVKVNVRRVSGMLLSENAQRKMLFFVRTFRQCQSWPQLLGGSLPQRTRSRQSTTEVHSWPWRENCEEKIGFHKKDELSLSFESVYIKRASIGRAFWLAFTISAQLNTNYLYLSCQPRKRSKLWQTLVQMRNRNRISSIADNLRTT